MRARLLLRRVHIWLGWIVGIPLLIWTVTGAVMAILPIETVRGEDLLKEPQPVAMTVAPVAPPLTARPVTSIALEQRAAGPRWVLRFADGDTSLADPATGAPLPPLSAEEAAAEVRQRYTGEAAITGVDRTAADDPPLDLRRKIDAWRVTMSDGTRFYVNAETGEIAARRTSLWRFYDFMWGLHILDLGTRENINNPWVRVFSVIGAASVVIGLVLLPLISWRRRRRRTAEKT
jgi:uncharacterized iron-regulated membrane protein